MKADNIICAKGKSKIQISSRHESDDLLFVSFNPIPKPCTNLGNLILCDLKLETEIDKLCKLNEMLVVFDAEETISEQDRTKVQ